MAIGPIIENGFYYDIDLDHSLSQEDLEKIEKRMKDLAKTKYRVIKKVVPKKEAVKVFKERKEIYKLEILEEIKEAETVGAPCDHFDDVNPEGDASLIDN